MSLTYEPIQIAANLPHDLRNVVDADDAFVKDERVLPVPIPFLYLSIYIYKMYIYIYIYIYILLSSLELSDTQVYAP